MLITLHCDTYNAFMDFFYTPNIEYVALGKATQYCACAVHYFHELIHEAISKLSEREYVFISHK